MFYLPLPIIIFVLLIVFFPLIILLIQFNIIHIGLMNLGLGPLQAFFYFIATLLLSVINIPIFKEKAVYEFTNNAVHFPLLRKNVRDIIIAINIGGCILPLLMCIGLLHKVSIPHLIPAILITSLSAYFSSKPVKHTGIKVMFIIPLIATVLSAIILASPASRAPFAFISGTIGILIGADIMHIKDFRKMGPGILSIGGAGVFDSIFFVGIIAAFIF